MSVYNGMPYLKDAVQSILNQSYKDFEFIIIDDASTDSTWKFLKSEKDKRIRLIKNKKNLGLAASLNIGLKIAKGDYIARMDADDISLPERLDTQLRFMEKRPDIDVCGAWIKKINSSNKVFGKYESPVSNSGIKKLLIWAPAIVHPTLFAKSSFFKKLNYYNPNFDYAEEYELLMRARNKFKMANVPRYLLLWRFWDRRRSREGWDKMEKIDFKIKSEAYKRGDFGKPFLLILGLKYFVTYLIPYNLKLNMFKLFKMI